MLGSWGSWIAEQATTVSQIATETVNEIIAEGKESLGNGSEQEQVLSSGPVTFWDSSNTNSNLIVASQYWSSNPMQWNTLIREGLGKDVNTFVISPEALIFESSCSLGGEETNIKTLLERILSHNNRNTSNSKNAEEEGKTRKFTLAVEIGNNHRHEANNNTTATSSNTERKNVNDNEEEGDGGEKQQTSSSSCTSNQVIFPSSFSKPSADNIRLMLKEDSFLADLRYDLVPKWVKEPDFWRNFGFRVYLLSLTESIEEAIEILKIVNDEHRNLPSDLDENNKKKKQNSQQQQTKKTQLSSSNETTLALLESVLDSLPSTSDELLVQSQSHRFHSNRSLKKKGFGVKRNAGSAGGAGNNFDYTDDAGHNQQQQQQNSSSSSLISFQELKDNIQATGEKESWQKHFLSRSTKELESVRSSVLMLEKLISEIDESVLGLLQQQQQNDQNKNDSTTELPSIELVQSIAEGCRFHKGRVGALLGELQSAPSDRVQNHIDLDTDSGKITLLLQNANKQLGEVLVKQTSALKKLGDALRAEVVVLDEDGNEEKETEENTVKVDEEQVVEEVKQQQQQQEDPQKPSTKNENDDLFEDDEDDFDYVATPVDEGSNKASPSGNTKNNNNNSEFVAQLPWDDDDE